MNNPFEKKTTIPVIPIVAGILVISIIALLFAPESGEDLREDIASGAKRGWGRFSGKAADEANNAKKYARKAKKYFKSKF